MTGAELQLAVALLSAALCLGGGIALLLRLAGIGRIARGRH